MDNNVIRDKSFDFAVRIVRSYEYLCTEKKEYVMSKQILRSGTSIGANVREAGRGLSSANLAAKLSIALKEADETLFWLELLNKTEYLDEKLGESLHKDCEELIKILVTITKHYYTTKTTL